MPVTTPHAPISKPTAPPAACAVALGAVLALLAPPACAETVELTNGNHLVASSVKRDGSGRYTIETPDGTSMLLPPGAVRKVTEDGPQALYEQRSRAMPDTLEAHRELAKWCQENQMGDEADHHWQRVLQFEPDDEDARVHLGYQKSGGRWMTRDEIMAGRGLQYYKGEYRTPQDIALREQNQKIEAAEAQWLRDLRLWLGWASSRRESRVEEGLDNIAAIRDPLAAPAVVRMLARTDAPDLRRLLIETLAELDHPAAVRELVNISLDDPDPEVRLRAIELLQRSGKPISLLPYVSTLRSKDNEMVNRAGMALRAIGNPEAISPLIDALVTNHKYTTDEAPPGQINASFSRSGTGGGGLSFGGGGPQIIAIDQMNTEVRRALVSLSGGIDLEYDETAWRRWFVNQQSRSSGSFDARRDQ